LRHTVAGDQRGEDPTIFFGRTSFIFATIKQQADKMAFAFSTNLSGIILVFWWLGLCGYSELLLLAMDFRILMKFFILILMAFALVKAEKDFPPKVSPYSSQTPLCYSKTSPNFLHLRPQDS
jgi:hypothetical protein